MLKRAVFYLERQKLSGLPRQLAFSSSENIFTLLQDISGKTLENVFSATLTRSRSREFIKAALLLYKKIPRIPSVKESEGSRVQGSKFKGNEVKPIAGQPADSDTRRTRRTSTQAEARRRRGHRSTRTRWRRKILL